MYNHKLTEADRWFIDKGQIDTMSRTRFDLGHIVVVCDHKHVLLYNFYEGTCPTCNSTKTVPFSRSSVEYNKPAEIRESFLKGSFPPNVLRKILPCVNAALVWTLGIMVLGLIVLIATGALPNALFLHRIERLLIPRTQLLLDRIGDFWVSDDVNRSFAVSGGIVELRSDAIFNNALAVLRALGIGLWSILDSLWLHLQAPIKTSTTRY